MNISHRPPSAAALTALSALQFAVTKTLDKKQRLGYYAVIRKNGEVIELNATVGVSLAEIDATIKNRGGKL